MLAAPDTAQVLALLAAGLALGLVGGGQRPGWRVRAGGVAALVLAAIGLNLAWLGPLHAANDVVGFAVQPDDDLRRRYADNAHWIPRRRAAYFHVGDLVDGRPLLWTPGTVLEPWRLLTLSGVGKVVEIPLPEPAPALDALMALPADRFGQLRRWKGEDLVYRLRLVSQGAKHADAFIALHVAGVDFVIPDRAWSALRREEP